MSLEEGNVGIEVRDGVGETQDGQMTQPNEGFKWKEWFHQNGWIAILSCSIFWVVVTPSEFGGLFGDGLPMWLCITDGVISVVFLICIVLEQVIEYGNGHLDIYVFLFERLKTLLIIDLVAGIPWELLAHKKGLELLVFLLWVRVFEVRRILPPLRALETIIKTNFHLLFAFRITKMILLYLTWFQAAGCILYYTASAAISTGHEKEETWLGLADIGDSFYDKYISSLYFATVTLTTVGFGDLHAVSTTVMIVMVLILLVSFTVLAVYTSYMVESLTEMIKTRYTEIELVADPPATIGTLPAQVDLTIEG